MTVEVLDFVTGVGIAWASGGLAGYVFQWGVSLFNESID